MVLSRQNPYPARLSLRAGAKASSVYLLNAVSGANGQDHPADMLNLQAQVPTIPVAATIRIQVPAGHRAHRVSLLPEQKDVAFSPAGSYISFQVPPFNLVCIALVDYA